MIKVDVAFEGSIRLESLLAKRATKFICRLVFLELVPVQLIVGIELFRANGTFMELCVYFEMNEFVFLKASSADRDVIAFIAGKRAARLLVVVLLHLKVKLEVENCRLNASNMFYVIVQ